MKKEDQLELIWASALQPKCPLHGNLAKRIGKYANKAIAITPERFTQLSNHATILFTYIKDKTEDITKDDCEKYLAWKIWHFKLLDPDRFVFNPLCKAKAQLIADKAILELHKSASRIKRNANEIKEVLGSTNDPKLVQILIGIDQKIHEQMTVAIETYNSLLASHQKILIGIDREIKQLMEGKN